MKNWFCEVVRRILQMFAGLFVFDMPGLDLFRKQTVRWAVCGGRMGKGAVISKHVRFYVPHGLKKGKITIGNKVRISENVAIDCSGRGG